MKHKITVSEMWAAEVARRKVELPWTDADEARLDAKRKAERESLAKWNAANPTKPDEDEDEDEEDEGQD